MSVLLFGTVKINEVGQFLETPIWFSQQQGKSTDYITKNIPEIVLSLISRHYRCDIYNIALSYQNSTLSQTSSDFFVSCCTGVLKTQWKNEKLLVTSNFSFSHSVFKTPVQRTFHLFYHITYGRKQTLSDWKSLKYVFWEIVRFSTITETDLYGVLVMGFCR